MNEKRRQWLRQSAALAASAAAPAVLAQAGKGDDFPTKPIRLIVAFPAGAGADLTGRTIGQKISESMGQPVVVENRAGANGSIAAGVVAKSPADGYTLLLIDRGGLGINPHLYKQLAYDPLKDFAYVSIATWGPYVLVTSNQLPVKSFAELVQLAKSKPGALNYASFGVGSMPQLNIEALDRAMGIKLTHVPYKGGSPAAAAVAAHEVDLTIATAPSVLGFIRDGRMRALAIGARKRSALLPEVPTVAEVGIPDDVLLPTYFGIAAPAGTPASVVRRLSAEIHKACTAPDVVERLAGAGLDAHGGTPQEMADTVRSDVQRFGALIREIGIQPE